MEQRLQKRIDYLQRILDTRFPKSVGITEPTLIVESRTPQIDDDMTDIQRTNYGNEMTKKKTSRGTQSDRVR